MLDSLSFNNSASLNLIMQTINMFPNYIAIKDKKSYYSIVNNAVANCFGYKSPQAIMEKNITDTDIRAPAALLAEDFYNQDKLVLTEEKNIKFICFTYYADNKNHLLLGEKFPIKNKRNEVIGVGSNYMDSSNLNMINFGLKLAKQNSRYSAKFKKNQFTLIINNNDSDFQLTPRQKECLFYLMRGKTTKGIAAVLNISSRTVETHIDIIKTKLNCHSKSTLIEKAIEVGFLNMVPESFLISANKL